jgi:hypothetical protein
MKDSGISLNGENKNWLLNQPKCARAQLPFVAIVVEALRFSTPSGIFTGILVNERDRKSSMRARVYSGIGMIFENKKNKKFERYMVANK